MLRNPWWFCFIVLIIVNYSNWLWVSQFVSLIIDQIPVVLTQDNFVVSLIFNAQFFRKFVFYLLVVTLLYVVHIEECMFNENIISCSVLWNSNKLLCYVAWSRLFAWNLINRVVAQSNFHFRAYLQVRKIYCLFNWML